MKNHYQASENNGSLLKETVKEQHNVLCNGKDKSENNNGIINPNGEDSLKSLEQEAKLPDGGWGWMVATGCFVITSIIPMVGPCFGILFSRYLLDLGTSSTTTAWIFNLQCFIWNIMGLITRPLTQEFGWRKIGVWGALLTSFSLIISAFSPNAQFLFFSFSVLCGTGGGAVTCICFTILPHYFDRHRGVANAMMMAGVCTGQIVGPPLVQFLQKEYGFKGATMLVGAIMLHGCIGASFFHPVAWHTKKTDQSTLHPPEEGDAPLLPNTEASKFGVGSDLKKSQSVKSFGETVAKEIDWVEVVTHARRLRMRNSPHISDVSQLSLSSSLAVSTVDIAGVGAGYVDNEMGDTASSNNKNESKSIWNIVVRVVNSTVSDLRVLRSPRALIISLGATFCINGFLNFLMMLPFAMQVAGHKLESSAWCISVSAICNLLMRMIVSSLSDWPKFNVKACYVSGFVVVFITTTVFPFLTDLWWMLIVMGVWGCGVGANMGLYNLVMIAVMGLENLAPVFGASCFMVAMGFITFGPIIGMVRDATESYLISMWMISGMLLISITLWLFMPAAQAYDKRKTKDNHHNKQLHP